MTPWPNPSACFFRIPNSTTLSVCQFGDRGWFLTSSDFNHEYSNIHLCRSRIFEYSMNIRIFNE